MHAQGLLTSKAYHAFASAPSSTTRESGRAEVAAALQSAVAFLVEPWIAGGPGGSIAFTERAATSPQLYMRLVRALHALHAFNSFWESTFLRASLKRARASRASSAPPLRGAHLRSMVARATEALAAPCGLMEWLADAARKPAQLDASFSTSRAAARRMLRKLSAQVTKAERTHPVSTAGAAATSVAGLLAATAFLVESGVPAGIPVGMAAPDDGQPIRGGDAAGDDEDWDTFRADLQQIASHHFCDDDDKEEEEEDEEDGEGEEEEEEASETDGRLPDGARPLFVIDAEGTTGRPEASTEKRADATQNDTEDDASGWPSGQDFLSFADAGPPEEEEEQASKQDRTKKRKAKDAKSRSSARKKQTKSSSAGKGQARTFKRYSD